MTDSDLSRSSLRRPRGRWRWLLFAVGALVVGSSGFSAVAFASDAAAPKSADRVVASTSPSVSYNQSCEKKATSQSLMNKCVVAELVALQGQLALALTAQERVLGQASVRSVQAQWTSFRSAECTLEAGVYKRGSIYPLIYGTCVNTGRIQQRAPGENGSTLVGKLL